jgi:hypothetical protein
MAYVGREVLLCEDGHLTIINSVNIMNESWRAAPRCKAIVRSNHECRKEWAWKFSIDDTNGQNPLPGLKLISRDNVHTCRCGHTHMIEAARYTPASDNPESIGWKEWREKEIVVSR